MQGDDAAGRGYRAQGAGQEARGSGAREGTATRPAAVAAAAASAPIWEGPAAAAEQGRRAAGGAIAVLFLGFFADHVQDAADDVADGEFWNEWREEGACKEEG